MDKLDKLTRVFVALFSFWILYSIITRNHWVMELLRPHVDQGRLGTASANLIASAIEILAAIGGVIILSVTRLLAFATQLINSSTTQTGPATGSRTNEPPRIDQKPSDQKSSDPKRLTDDLSRLLIQAVVETQSSFSYNQAQKHIPQPFQHIPLIDCNNNTKNR